MVKVSETTGITSVKTMLSVLEKIGILSFLLKTKTGSFNVCIFSNSKGLRQI